MLEKTFRPDEVEPRLYRQWEERGLFAAGQKPDAQPYTVVIPPPNVTGSLHMGHALNNTLQDILVRFERMRRRDVLWQPGMDHAGIATQMVVERKLQEENRTDRRTMGRDAFIRRVWQWKDESGGQITEQLRRLGASCDWSRERFTMDEGLSRAVIKVFVTLYREGLIYRDKRLVNWDPKFQTAISDIEVVQKEVKGHLWHFRYPLADKPGRFITVATTRPETMLGDTGIAVHPDDERYKDLVGETVELPLVGRRIPIVADEYADPEQGSGAVKITPAHDFNDFEVGRRHNLPLVNIFDASAHLSDEVPEAYRGLERFEARKKIVAAFEELELLEKVDDHVHAVPHGDRSKVPIEPWLTDQWYVNAGELAKPAIKAVEDGSMKFVPKNWENTYFEWMRNIQPWCVSRQLWWGHRIPAWYGPDGEVFVAESEEEAHRLAQARYGEPVMLNQDEDVLDTWFSSALWPFSTLGWPDETDSLKRYFPTDVLVTGFDIIFFWVARMMMMSLHFMKEVPFHTVYLHALVRDEKGQKMSKSLGNVINPLELIDEYGADALRFTLAAMAAQGRDIKLAKSRIEGYRNFGTKLWNASRFCQMNECVRIESFDPRKTRLTVNKWVIGETARTAADVTQALDTLRFNEAAGALYHFVWHIFCDWYLEFIKPLLNGPDGAEKDEARATAAWVLDEILRLLHPFMPYITEELWERLAEHGHPRESMLIVSEWPQAPDLVDGQAAEEMNWMLRLISEIRSVRAEMNVPAGAKVPLVLANAGETTRERLERHEDIIKRMARLEWTRVDDEIPGGSVQIVLDEATLALPLAEVIDFAQEAKRLETEIGKLAKDIQKMEAKLGNEQFISKAPEDVIEEQKARRAEALERSERLRKALANLSAAG